MVSLPVPVPVTQLVDEAVAVQDAESRARLSAISTVPSGLLIVVPGPPDPRFAEAGALIVSAPTVTVNIIVVSGSPPAVGAVVVLTPEPCSGAGSLVAACADTGASKTPKVAPAPATQVTSQSPRAQDRPTPGRG
jgi:hypothetical protein